MFSHQAKIAELGKNSTTQLKRTILSEFSPLCICTLRYVWYNPFPALVQFQQLGARRKLQKALLFL